MQVNRLRRPAPVLFFQQVFLNKPNVKIFFYGLYLYKLEIISQTTQITTNGLAAVISQSQLILNPG